MTLLTKCNADVFKALLDFKAEHPQVGQYLIDPLQKHEYWWQMTGDEILRYAAYLPHGIWNNKITTFQLLFESKQTTKMP
jgi:hypothetical protein